MIRFPARFWLALLALALGGAANGNEIARAHGISIFDNLKYPADFQHFEYANPDAPKGGHVKLPGLGSFDSLNNWILKGVSPTGLAGIYDSLTVQSQDEPFSQYGLVAESIEVPADKSWVTFYLREQVRWHDGKPLTAADVAWTMDTLKSKGHPFYRTYYAAVERVEVIDPRTVRFVFSETGNSELPLIVGEMAILPKHYYADRDFEKTTLDPPLGSGPYRVKSVDAGRSIVYERVRDYWAADLPVRRGSNNFDLLQYDYYRDMTVALEALKAGDIDFRLEYISKNWMTAYDFPALNEGRVIKEDLPDGSIQPMQAWAFNLRKPKYQDQRVREALGYVYDFEWINKNLFYGAYKRNDSFFQNSEMAARGLPTGGELALLEQFRDQLPESVFTTEFRLPTTDGSGNPRSNLRKAIQLFREAGWEVRDGKMTNVASGERFTMEFITRQPSVEKLALTFKKALERIGVELKVRVIDTAQYVKLIEGFEFDTTTLVIPQSMSPGNEQYSMWSSKAADEPVNRNYAGIKHPVIDKLIERIVRAESRQQQVDACRALDRILRHHHYFIPQYYADTYRIAYWNKFSRPVILPKYAMGFEFWWVDPKKAAKL